MIRQNTIKRFGKQTLFSLISFVMLFTLSLGAAISPGTTATASGVVEPTPPVAAAQVPPVPWTAVASTGAVKESGLALYAFEGACVQYRAITGSLNPIDICYNVVNTFDRGSSPSVPGWTTLELGFTAPGSSVVTATLFKVARCTGQRSEVCTIRGTNSPDPKCLTCTFLPNTIDFSSALYYVCVRLTRSIGVENPRACTLRIF